jgi:hypothetical protein
MPTVLRENVHFIVDARAWSRLDKTMAPRSKKPDAARLVPRCIRLTVIDLLCKSCIRNSDAAA